jgi:hypothetical protein
MDFYHWFVALYRDAAQKGCSSRIKADTASIWAQVYLAGVQPSVAAVAAWCVLDPERWEDIRETEPALMVRKPVRSERIAA